MQFSHSAQFRLCRALQGGLAPPSRVSRWCWAVDGSRLGLLIDQVVTGRRLRSISSLHAQPSHDTLYMTSSSAARSTSTQGLSPSVERRVEACQKSVLAAGHWSPGVSWAVGRQCTVTRCHSRYLGITSSRPVWDEERCWWAVVDGGGDGGRSGGVSKTKCTRGRWQYDYLINAVATSEAGF